MARIPYVDKSVLDTAKQRLEVTNPEKESVNNDYAKYWTAGTPTPYKNPTLGDIGESFNKGNESNLLSGLISGAGKLGEYIQTPQGQRIAGLIAQQTAGPNSGNIANAYYGQAQQTAGLEAAQERAYEEASRERAKAAEESADKELELKSAEKQKGMDIGLGEKQLQQKAGQDVTSNMLNNERLAWEKQHGTEMTEIDKQKMANELTQNMAMLAKTNTQERLDLGTKSGLKGEDLTNFMRDPKSVVQNNPGLLGRMKSFLFGASASTQGADFQRGQAQTGQTQTAMR